MSAGDLRASDADRDQVCQVLHAAYAEGRISAEEHSERTEAVIRARTFDELTALTVDLVPPSLPAPTPSPPGAVRRRSPPCPQVAAPNASSPC